MQCLVEIGCFLFGNFDACSDVLSSPDLTDMKTSPDFDFDIISQFRFSSDSLTGLQGFLLHITPLSFAFARCISGQPSDGWLFTSLLLRG